MKGLAFKPPYGLAVFYGKDIENRPKGFTPNCQDWVLAYSCKANNSSARAYYDAAVPVCIQNGWEPPPFDDIPKGVLLGVVWMGDRRWGTVNQGWGFKDNWWFTLRSAKLFKTPIPFTPAFGLGVFEVPDSLVEGELGELFFGGYQQLSLL